MDSNSLSLPWLLIAAPQLDDPNFKKAVVLIVEDGEEGAMGFVINRPMPTPLADIIDFEGRNGDIPDNIPVWYGGPVAADNGIIMCPAPGTNAQFESPARVVLTASDDALDDLIARANELFGPRSPEEDLCPYRFIVGYSGWGKGQLEEEIREGVWLQIPSSHLLLFNCPWNRLWDEAYATIGIAPREFIAESSPFLN